MKRAGTFFAAVAVLILALGMAAWQFVDQVSSQLWMNSIRTITESTHQGANALNIQLEGDFDALDVMWENIVQARPSELKLVLTLYQVVEPDVVLYFRDKGSVRENVKPDQAVSDFLKDTALERGLLDSHISSVTGEDVFDIFVKVFFEDGTEAYLVKEYRTREIAQQFTLSFYDNKGFSYLVNRDGGIMVRPAHKNSNQAIRNLFDTISDTENDPDRIAKFQKAVQGLDSGWEKFIYEKEGMVFCYEPLRADSEWLLVSIVPENEITAQTNNILKRTMVFSGLVAGTILVMAAVFYGIKMHESRKYTGQLQRALEEADKANRAKGQFLMDMSHDIRTPLNAIIGLTSIARENTGDLARIEDCLEKIRISGIHLLSLVSDVMDMSQIEQGANILKEESFSISRIFSEATGFMGHKAQEAGLTMEIAPVRLEKEYVVGDPLRVRQILLNIIDNAIKYTPSGGKVFLELTQAGEDGEGKGIYRFRCRDTGIGMEPEFLERVFLPFERARNTTFSKIAGTGVGLAITKSLLDLLGGSISVESEPGKGSYFTVEFCLKLQKEASPPVEEREGDEVAVPEEAGEEEVLDYTSRRVLLVEDNELNMEIAVELIGITGVQVETACDGQEAVQMFGEHPCGYYDLIFMDIQMPIMDGYEATRQIRGMDREDAGKVPIVALSANALAEDVKNSLQAGMNSHVAKPVELDSIEKVLAQYFR
ncbi:MAG: response regulator [Lachnospiraceae bacterium]|nr:response regulator [Lachnospiraceae bacterium]